MIKRRFLSLFVVTVAVAACGGGGALSYKSPADWVAQSSQTGSLLVLAPTAGTWSEAKTYNTKSGPLSIQSKFLQHKGTTCEFEVKAKNPGSARVAASMALVKSDKQKNAEGKVVLAGHRFSEVALAPGESAVWEMETRECPIHFGSTTDMKDCAECGPVLGFL